MISIAIIHPVRLGSGGHLEDLLLSLGLVLIAVLSIWMGYYLGKK